MSEIGSLRESRVREFPEFGVCAVNIFLWQLWKVWLLIIFWGAEKRNRLHCLACWQKILPNNNFITEVGVKTKMYIIFDWFSSYTFHIFCVRKQAQSASHPVTDNQLEQTATAERNRPCHVHRIAQSGKKCKQKRNCCIESCQEVSHDLKSEMSTVTSLEARVDRWEIA